MKLMIAVPARDYMHVDFVRSLTDLLLRLKSGKVDFELRLCPGTLVHVARDNLAGQAINGNFTHVLWLDDDMVFGPELLDDLQFSGKPFVTGICHARRKPYNSCLFSDLDLNHLTRIEEYPINTFEVAGCGFACVLISTDILKEVMLHYKTCFLPMKGYGEDLAFCLRARELGHHIYAEPGVRLGHIGHVVIYQEDHEKYLRDLENQGGI